MPTRIARRRWLAGTAALLASGVLPNLNRAWAASYPATIAALHAARGRETVVTYRYLEFGRKAGEEGYRGIAYLFTAFAASEGIHAGNFEKILLRLSAEIAPIPPPELRVGSTRENLILAVDEEIGSIEDFYPRLLERIRPEGHEDAMKSVRWAWMSERQHRDKIREIQRWTGTQFKRVAKAIDQKTGLYFVCRICGSTLNAIPAEQCPVCREPATHYRRIEPPA